MNSITITDAEPISTTLVGWLALCLSALRHPPAQCGSSRGLLVQYGGSSAPDALLPVFVAHDRSLHA
eukprot:CAMPEP_0175649112 /NCGR_PEP_ID=MMETSP0097-20121207/8677_1 /TAXON_ID=311494 /ORGANISM="Alexandrium monilatum, Strain CCMP3105" /LENGTH=66 /DNA_ID=CAMNT_0016955047 /DNA_START=51 /DNA_END=247 /DNA_ORIENTATION=+